MDDMAPLQVAHFQPSVAEHISSGCDPSKFWCQRGRQPTGQCGVRLGNVHSESELIVCSQMTCLRDGGGVFSRILDYQGIGIGQQRGCPGRFRLRVPDDFLGRVEGSVVQYGVGCAIGSARDVDINLRRLD